MSPAPGGGPLDAIVLAEIGAPSAIAQNEFCGRLRPPCTLTVCSSGVHERTPVRDYRLFQGKQTGDIQPRTMMTNRFLDDPERWRDRAEDARRVAMEMLDPPSRRKMLDIAESYESLARKAAERDREGGWAAPGPFGSGGMKAEEPQSIGD
jgi:hypothetical protein